MPSAILSILALFGVIFAQGILTELAVPSEENVTSLLNSSNPLKEEAEVILFKESDLLSNIPIRLKSSAGIRELNISQNFMDFLTSKLKESKNNKNSSRNDGVMRQGYCQQTCFNTLYYIRDLQIQQTNSRSLFELFYHLSVSPGCYCNGLELEFEDEEEEEEENEGSQTGILLIDMLINFNTNNNNHHHNDHNNEDNYEEGYSCQWGNVINWLIRLIRCRIYDLRHFNLHDACFECICRN